ncbi:MAG: hypothetical protein ACI9U2_002816 [Bradymonadia bacterium]|jgi:hypothetical protein
MRFVMMMLAALALTACGNKDKASAEAKPVVKSGPAAAPAQKATMVKKATPGQAMPKPTGGEPAMPKPAGSQPAAVAQPAGSQPAKAPHAGSQPAAAAAGGTAEVSGALAGTIALSAALKSDVKPGSVLFIIVRRDEGEGKRGMMIAAKKLPVPNADIFPLKYIVTGRDVMMAGTKLFGPVKVEARIDNDGDALSKNPGDITGGPIGVKTGAKDANFELKQKL